MYYDLMPVPPSLSVVGADIMTMISWAVEL